MSNAYLLDLVRKRFDYPSLKRAVIDARNRWPGSHTLIEDKGSGTSLIQDLRNENIAVVGITPEADKVTRLYANQVHFESGSVLPARRAVPTGSHRGAIRVPARPP